ncbi:MAG: glycosyltransferase [Elusimicrobiota bacterium]|nr:MAG: glycosyltransferase [Elusimicrobiota bacterium]
MIKVVQVVECGGPGGTGEQVAAICNGLDPARFHVSLAYAARGGSAEEYRAKCAGAREAHHVPEMTREISPGRDAAAFRRLRQLFAERRPDVVHAHSSKAGVLARVAARAAGVPAVFYTPHGYGFLQQDRPAASRLLYRALEAAASRIGTVVACSPAEAEQARALGAPRVETVCDAYLGGFAEPLPHDGVVVGSCGRMAYARNPDAWLLLAQRLTDSRNGLRCVWIGGGEEERRARVLLENMNLAGRAEITGWLGAAEARERLRALDLFVHYSRWDAMPNAVLEAMAAGLPVVASDNPGNRSAVVDGETGFLARTEVELLERCQQLIDDAPLRLRLGAAGRERVRREFSLERMLGSLSALYAGAS